MYCNTDYNWAHSSSEIREKRNGLKKLLLTKTCKCYKASKFLGLAKSLFDMKQTLRGFFPKIWISEVYLEPSPTSLMKFFSENS